MLKLLFAFLLPSVAHAAYAVETAYAGESRYVFHAAIGNGVSHYYASTNSGGPIGFISGTYTK